MFHLNPKGLNVYRKIEIYQDDPEGSRIGYLFRKFISDFRLFETELFPFKIYAAHAPSVQSPDESV